MTIGGNARPAQPVDEIAYPRGPAGGATPLAPWDVFIRSTGPWFWWRLNDLAGAGDLRTTRDEMGRLHARYRVPGPTGAPPPVESELDEFDYGVLSGAGDADPAGYPYLLSGQSGLVVDNPNRAALFKDCAAWVQTPHVQHGSVGTGAWAECFFPWFLQFTALCVFRINATASSPDFFTVYDFFASVHPAADMTWRVGWYGSDGTATLFAESSNDSTSAGSPLITVGDDHLLVVTNEVDAPGFDSDLLRWRGDWTPGTIYETNDVVSTIVTDAGSYALPSAGNHWIATADNSSVDPDTSSDPPWAAAYNAVVSSTFSVYLDNVLYDTCSGFGSAGIPSVLRMATAVDPSNGYGPVYHGTDVTQDENVIWARVLSTDERATALDLSGV